MHTVKKGLYQSCIKIDQNFKFWIFAIFFSFSLTWDDMGENISNDIFSESAQQIFSPKFMHIPRKGLYQTFV